MGAEWYSLYVYKTVNIHPVRTEFSVTTESPQTYILRFRSDYFCLLISLNVYWII